MPCRNCNRPKPIHRRGLCWRCYFSPGIRDRFPSENRYGRRGVSNGSHLPSVPTSAAPGSAAKILVLALRAAMGAKLWHEADAAECRSRRSMILAREIPARVMRRKVGVG